MPRAYTDHFLSKQVSLPVYENICKSAGREWMDLAQILSLGEEEALNDVTVSFG